MLPPSIRRRARPARLLAVRQLIDWDVPSGAAAQIVAELASNAATHGRVAGRDFRLTLTLRGGTDAAGGDGGCTLRIAVADAPGESRPRVARIEAPDAESGRGLLLVAAYADRWGIPGRSGALQDGLGGDRRPRLSGHHPYETGPVCGQVLTWCAETGQ